MTAAAAELRVTHGAVSRHVKALEDRFGLLLLQRWPRSVAPTPEGAQLAAELAEAFNRMTLALSRVQPTPLTLSCSATIMMNWLLPRLGRFKRDHPAVDLRLNLNYGEVDFIRDEISVAIRNDMYRPPPTAMARLLLREEIGPVCHPDYARRFRSPGRRTWRPPGCSPPRRGPAPGGSGRTRSAPRRLRCSRTSISSTSIW